jgi:uncharacterized protein (DUF58 family)
MLGSRTPLSAATGKRSAPSILRRTLERSELFQFLARKRRIDGMPITLQHRRVFILPTLHGVTFCIALVLMLVGSTNYSLGLGFALTFLLAGISIVGLVNTFRNVIGLRITMGRAEPVFAGDEATFLMHVENPYRFARHSLETLRDGRVTRFDVANEGWATVSIATAAPRRGWLEIGKVTIQTRYPLGLFRAWSPIRPDARVLVYPRPEVTPLPPEAPIPRDGHTVDLDNGGEDFAALRAYQPGDSPRHIAWKITARTDELVTKQFSSLGATELILSWTSLPPRLDLESRLSRLAGWIIEAEASQVRYGLAIPGTEIEPGSGLDHRNQCLKALAIFDGNIGR